MYWTSDLGATVLCLAAYSGPERKEGTRNITFKELACPGPVRSLNAHGLLWGRTLLIPTEAVPTLPRPGCLGPELKPALG